LEHVPADKTAGSDDDTDLQISIQSDMTLMAYVTFLAQLLSFLQKKLHQGVHCAARLV
jgi:hypothetical protein